MACCPEVVSSSVPRCGWYTQRDEVMMPVPWTINLAAGPSSRSIRCVDDWQA